MMQPARPVKVIQPKAKKTGLRVLPEDDIIPVGAYARVSTDSDEQQESYEAQVSWYTQHIQSNPKWKFAGVYADEAISGTNTKKRDGFNQMVADALAGKFKLLLTKSVSRFARNTVDSLVTVRKLKEHGVEIYFEKENIYTFDAKGELLITLMSSLAQEESRSISENVTWGKRKRMQDGKFTLPYKQFLGYEKGEDGLPQIVESEAAIVRLIYGLFLEGKSPSYIAKELMERGIPSPGSKVNWRPNTVESILTNEKYKGDAILQKKFTVDFLTKRTKVNEGEVPQYYVENSHPAIIAPEVFDIVQHDMQKRRASGRQTNCTHCFSGKIGCGLCGRVYGSRVWGSNTKYRRKVWQCMERVKKGAPCRSPHVDEAAIERAFIEAVNGIIRNKAEILAEYADILHMLTDTSALESEIATVSGERDMCMRLAEECVADNARHAQDQEAFQKRYAEYNSRYEAAEARLTELEAAVTERTVKRERIAGFLDAIRRQNGLLAGFDEGLWFALVDQVCVEDAGRLRFVFRSGIQRSICI